MAGSNAGFNPAEFRSGIRLAMTMGSPGLTNEKATFRWNRAQTFGPQDPANRPYHWNQVPLTDTTPDPVVIDNVAVEYGGSNTTGTAVGTFDPQRVTLTMLDDDYDLIRGADVVEIGGNDYEISTTTVTGLFDVDVYTINAERR